MPNVFLVSDTHFSHTNICKFLRNDGSKLRPWEDVSEHDEVLIAKWNAVVKPEDKVYHLGDVVINRKALPQVMPRLNGRKVLIKGNHDIFQLEDYTPWFYDVRAYHKLDRCILSHIPLHPCNLTRFHGNVHGHLHDLSVGDPKYYSVCVEQTDWAPVELSVVLEYFKQHAA